VGEWLVRLLTTEVTRVQIPVATKKNFKKKLIKMTNKKIKK
jgi:hypothetical protein